MTETEAKQLTEIVKQLNSINNKLDTLIGKERTDSQELKDRGIVNGLLHICTHKEFTDKQYTDALRQLNELPFGLSTKQIAWILVYCNAHPQCGEQIEIFIKRQIEKSKDYNEYKKGIAEVLRSKYKNDNNDQYIERLIQRIQEL